jgi:hypothetical protein
MAIMEMNPASPAFQRIFSNPFAFAAFKSTEPHLAGAWRLGGRRRGGRARARPLAVAEPLPPVARAVSTRSEQGMLLGQPTRTPGNYQLTACSFCQRRGTANKPPGTPPKTEYVTLDLAAAYTDAGFNAPQQLENTPRHRTVVARKPQAA